MRREETRPPFMWSWMWWWTPSSSWRLVAELYTQHHFQC